MNNSRVNQICIHDEGSHTGPIASWPQRCSFRTCLRSIAIPHALFLLYVVAVPRFLHVFVSCRAIPHILPVVCTLSVPAVLAAVCIPLLNIVLNIEMHEETQ